LGGEKKKRKSAIKLQTKKNAKSGKRQGNIKAETKAFPRGVRGERQSQ